jgi:hypothetical protein
MSEQSPAVARWLDPASRLSIKRFLCTLVLFLVWAQVPSGRPPSVNMALMALCATAIEAALALFSRERLPGPSLNRWDIALAFLGVYCVSKIIA